MKVLHIHAEREHGLHVLLHPEVLKDLVQRKHELASCLNGQRLICEED